MTRFAMSNDLPAAGVVGADVVGDGVVLLAVVTGVPRPAHPVVRGEIAAERWVELGQDGVVEGDVTARPGGPQALGEQDRGERPAIRPVKGVVGEDGVGVGERQRRCKKKSRRRRRATVPRPGSAVRVRACRSGSGSRRPLVPVPTPSGSRPVLASECEPDQRTVPERSQEGLLARRPSLR